LQIRQKATLRFIVCMGYIVANHRLLPSDLANFCHDITPLIAKKKIVSASAHFDLPLFRFSYEDLVSRGSIMLKIPQ
jgi:hypothetical protein